MSAMLNDYEEQYHEICKTPEDAKELRDSLLKALNGFAPGIVVAGYEEAIELNPDKMPTVADIARGCVSEYTEAPKQTKEPTKNDADTSKDESSINDNHPLKLIAEAFKNHSTPENETQEERNERLAAIHSTHNDLIISHKALKYIRKPIFNPLSDLTCSWGGCSKGGSRSAGVVGGSKFYCGDHFLQAV